MSTVTVKILDIDLGAVLQGPVKGLPTPAEHAAYDRLFSAVQNPEHWKGPINVVVEGATQADLALLADIILFYTATPATFEPLGEGRVQVKAAGYWAGPAN